MSGLSRFDGRRTLLQQVRDQKDSVTIVETRLQGIHQTELLQHVADIKPGVHGTIGSVQLLSS